MVGLTFNYQMRNFRFFRSADANWNENPSDTQVYPFLSNSYAKSKDECTTFLGIGDTAFYSYCNTLKEIGFDLCQQDGKYWLEYTDQDFRILQNIFHFSVEEGYLLSWGIDAIAENHAAAIRLKHKLKAFLNQDKAIDDYIRKEKSGIVSSLRKAQQQRKQILLVNYASGNSQTVRNRMVEPFEFRDDFNLVWAFDTLLKTKPSVQSMPDRRR